jgi:hypothetical protein
MPRLGFVLSNFQSASYDVTPTPRGEKEFRVEFDITHWALKSKKYSETSFTAIYRLTFLAQV